MDPTFWLALVAAVLSASSILLHVIAPLTKTTVDDRLRDDVDKLLAFVNPPPTPPAVVVVDKSKLTALLVLLVLGLAGSTQLACTTVRPVAATVVTAELDCTAPTIAGFVASLGHGAEAYLAAKIAGDGRAIDTPAIKADLKAVASKAWSCAVTTALAALLNQPVARTLTGPPGPDLEVLRVAVGEVKGELGVASVKTAAGVL